MPDEPQSPRQHEHEQGGLRPIPDPTLLTMEALRRDIGAMTEVFQAKLDGVAALTREQHDHIKERFEWFEGQRKEQKADTERNVLAAIAAQTKQVDLLTSSVAAEVTSLRRDIDSLRERINTMGSSIGGGV